MDASPLAVADAESSSTSAPESRPGKVEDLSSIHSLINLQPLEPGVREDWRMRWTSSFQGETEYQCGEKRLRFRWGKCPWRWSWQGDRPYWSYESPEAFEAQHNGNHGLLTDGSEPVDAQTLNLFQRLFHRGARTGFFCHRRKRWVACRPTSKRPSHRTWLQTRSRG